MIQNKFYQYSQYIKHILILIGFCVIFILAKIINLLPYKLLRICGRSLGAICYYTAYKRRRIADINLKLCFPYIDHAVLKHIVLRHFMLLGEIVLDYAIVFFGRKQKIIDLVDIDGIEHIKDNFRNHSLSNSNKCSNDCNYSNHAKYNNDFRYNHVCDCNKSNCKDLEQTNQSQQYQQHDNIIYFFPHFLGMEMCAIRLSIDIDGYSIYAEQSNPYITKKILECRSRFMTNGAKYLFSRNLRLTHIIRAIKNYSLPIMYASDQDPGDNNVVFVPFFAVQQCPTLSMLPRFAQLIKAKVVTVFSIKQNNGRYLIKISPPWIDYPDNQLNLEQNVRLMNQKIEESIMNIDYMPNSITQDAGLDQSQQQSNLQQTYQKYNLSHMDHLKYYPYIEQYFWLHRRFKTMPDGKNRGKLYAS